MKSKKVQEFRDEFNLNEKEYDEQKLLGILQKYKFDNADAFSSLFQQKYKEIKFKSDIQYKYNFKLIIL